MLGAGHNGLLSGDEGNDILDSGEGTGVASFGGKGDDIIHGNGGERRMTGGEGNDNITIHGVPTNSSKLLINFNNLTMVSKVADADSSGLYISDSSGIDTLSFAEFDLGINLNLDIFNAYQIYTTNSDTLTLNGTFETFIGTQNDDVIHVDPLQGNARHVDGGGSVNGDTLYVADMGVGSNDDGGSTTYKDYQPVTYENVVNLVITSGLSSCQIFLFLTDSGYFKITLIHSILRRLLTIRFQWNLR